MAAPTYGLPKHSLGDLVLVKYKDFFERGYHGLVLEIESIASNYPEYVYHLEIRDKHGNLINVGRYNETILEEYS